jgi:hypothetical protein
LRVVLSNRPNRVDVSFPSPGRGKRPVSGTPCFLAVRKDLKLVDSEVYRLINNVSANNNVRLSPTDV